MPELTAVIVEVGANVKVGGLEVWIMIDVGTTTVVAESVPVGIMETGAVEVDEGVVGNGVEKRELAAAGVVVVTEAIAVVAESVLKGMTGMIADELLGTVCDEAAKVDSGALGLEVGVLAAAVVDAGSLVAVLSTTIDAAVDEVSVSVADCEDAAVMVEETSLLTDDCKDRTRLIEDADN